MQVVLHHGLTPSIPDEALFVHTRRGQEMGRTMEDWFRDGTVIAPEVDGRDRTWNEHLHVLSRELDPSQVAE